MPVSSVAAFILAIPQHEFCNRSVIRAKALDDGCRRRYMQRPQSKGIVIVQIILRRASDLARACSREAAAKLRAFETNKELRLSAHSVVSVTDVTERLQTASNAVMQQLDEALELYRAQARIRGLIGQANADVVSPLLAERDTYLTPAEKALKAHLPQNPLLSYARGDDTDCEHNATEVAARLTGIRKQLEKTTNTVVNDVVRVPRLSEANHAAIRERIATIERRATDLNEELGRANFVQSITLPDEVVTILRKHKIIG